jgi:hypothetical protein
MKASIVHRALKTLPILTMISFLGGSDLQAQEHFVYSVVKGLDFGNPGEQPQRDYYVNIGTNQGVKTGDRLEVLRRVPTYDVPSQKLYRDITFPFARLKVIHSESNAAIARLDGITAPEKTPVLSPSAVMVGDLVRTSD